MGLMLDFGSDAFNYIVPQGGFNNYSFVGYSSNYVLIISAFQCRCTAGQYICLASKKCLARADVCEGETPGDDLIADSCFTGTETGDDEDNNGFGVQCTA